MCIRTEEMPRLRHDRGYTPNYVWTIVHTIRLKEMRDGTLLSGRTGVIEVRKAKTRE